MTNPPFNCAVDFVERALQLAERGVAMLVRTQFLEGDGRYKRLFSRRPPQVVAQFVERVPMHRGRWVVDGSTATAYCWLVWLRTLPHDWRHTRAIWIPPSRKALAKHDDWLRFAGCMDIPGLQGKATQLTLAETQALVKGGRQAEARQFELGALL